MKSFKKFLLALGACALVHGAQAAPTTWAGNGHEYDVISAEGISWTAASAAAAALGGGWHLATITSLLENTFVKSLLPAAQPDRSHYWLGATDALAEGNWQWVTGETWSYTDWSGGEPNNSGDEDYLAYDLRIQPSYAFAWNDAPDNLAALYPGFSNGYVIERSTNVPEPGALTLIALGLLALGVSRRRTRTV